jgi:ribosomal protein S18 acetylase RimI-like enzyme
VIREARADDIQDIVRIHLTTLPGDFLPRLGNRFLRKVFYPGVMDSKHGLVVVQEEGGSICSFIVFAFNAEKLTREATGQKIMLAAYILAALIRDFSLFRELSAHLSGFKTEIYTDIKTPLEKIPELFVMATAPHYQSQGMGGDLLERGIEIVSRAHAECLVKTSSRHAKKFYAKHGFKEIGMEYRGARRVHLLLRS